MRVSVLASGRSKDGGHGKDLADCLGIFWSYYAIERDSLFKLVRVFVKMRLFWRDTQELSFGFGEQVDCAVGSDADIAQPPV